MTAVPFFFGPGGENLFGWYHRPGGNEARRTAVLLCPPLGFDYIGAYRCWRLLAERLAASGFGVLRFDYLGTGNSAGDAGDPDQIDRWLRSIELAAGEARVRSGSETLAMIGLRFGATLAATAAARLGGASSLVLWSPYKTGRAYAREMSALSALTRGENGAADPGEIEAAGFLVTRATLDGLQGIDLLKLDRHPAPRTLVIERDDLSPDPALAGHLESLGSAVTVDRLGGTADALLQPMLSIVPEPILDRIVSWLCVAHPAQRGLSHYENGADRTPADCEDHPLFFGKQDRLFGILTSPGNGAKPSLAVVLLNTGCEYHVGPHRMYVPLAREWAGRGYPVFRFDLGGIGDSRPPQGGDGNNAYPDHAMDDVAAAVSEVRARTGATRVLLIGICSGGWHCFRAARDGLPVDGILAINPPLYMREGAGYTLQELVEQREIGRYGKSLKSADKWKKLLKGRASVSTFVRVVVIGVLRWLRTQAAGFGIQFGADTLGTDLRKIVSRGIPATFVFSKTDLTLTYFKLHAKGPIRRARGRMGWTVVDDADHTFGPLPAQRSLRALMLDFLTTGGRAVSRLQ